MPRGAELSAPRGINCKRRPAQPGEHPFKHRARDFGAVVFRLQEPLFLRVGQKAALHEYRGCLRAVEHEKVPRQRRVIFSAQAVEAGLDAVRKLFVLLPASTEKDLSAAPRRGRGKAVLMHGDDDVRPFAHNDLPPLFHVAALVSLRGKAVQSARVLAREHHAKARIGKQFLQVLHDF